jgi:hypothetical protein
MHTNKKMLLYLGQSAGDGSVGGNDLTAILYFPMQVCDVMNKRKLLHSSPLAVSSECSNQPAPTQLFLVPPVAVVGKAICCCSYSVSDVVVLVAKGPDRLLCEYCCCVSWFSSFQVPT